jgi:hypothetical protein
MMPLLPVVPVALVAPYGWWAAGIAGVIAWFAVAVVTLRMRNKLSKRIVVHECALCTRCMHALEESDGRCPGCDSAYILEEEVQDWFWFNLKL